MKKTKEVNKKRNNHNNPNGEDLDGDHGVDGVVTLAGEDLGEEPLTPLERRQLSGHELLASQAVSALLAVLKAPLFDGTGLVEVHEVEVDGADAIATACVDDGGAPTATNTGGDGEGTPV